MRFAGQSAVVTGSAQGIGLAVARQLAAEGASVLMADTQADAVLARAAELDPSGVKVIAVKYDAGIPTDADAVVRMAMQHFGAIDLVVPAAGIYPFEPFATLTDEQWDRMIAINLSGTARLCMRAVTEMGEVGAFVLLTSVAAHRGGEIGSAHYGATKGGLVSLGRGMARELAPKIRVNMVSPGLIETPMTQRVIAERGEAFVKATPMGRFGTAADVAGAVCFLLSGEASFITGEVLHVNGGSYIGG